MSDGTDIPTTRIDPIGRNPDDLALELRTMARRSPLYRMASGELLVVTQAVAQSAVDMSSDVGARAIIAFSVSGATSKYLSKHRPARRIYAFTPLARIYNRLSLVWGVAPKLISKIQDTRKLMDAAEHLLVDKGVLKQDDLVVIITGLALKSGSTNMIKIHQVGRDD